MCTLRLPLTSLLLPLLLLIVLLSESGAHQSIAAGLCLVCACVITVVLQAGLLEYLQVVQSMHTGPFALHTCKDHMHVPVSLQVRDNLCILHCTVCVGTPYSQHILFAFSLHTSCLHQ